jgi:hypothetical protein
MNDASIDSNAATVLLTLVVAPEQSEAMIDWLLDHPAVRGFSSQEGSGHGSDPRRLNVEDQVAGRRPRVFFTLLLAVSAAPDLLVHLRTDFAGCEVHYWLTPVLSGGRLDQANSGDSTGMKKG